MKVCRLVLIALILVILSISCANASEMADEGILSDLNDLDNQIIVQEELSQDIQSDDDSNQDMGSNDDLDKSNQDAKVLNSNQINSAELNSSQLSSGNVHIVTQSNYSKYFDKNGLLKSGVISDYDTIDLSGRFISKNFIFTSPCHITSSNKASLTNCMIKFENMSASGRSSVSNLYIRNSVEWCAGVYLLNSTNVDVYGNDIYCTGANGNPVRVIYSNYSSIFGNRLETNFTGYMNLSWKRAGILLGDSHHNNIYSNDVTIKDSNPIYLTTYGFEKSNYNIIFNNTVRSSAISEDSGLSNPSAWAYGIHLMGDYNLALNNTIHNVYRGIDSEGSFNVLAGNIIFNITGGYFEGNDGTEGGDYGIHASYDNIVANNTIFDSKLTGSAIYLMPNNTAYGNIVYNISGHSGLEFNYYADNCQVYGNIIDIPVANPIYVFGRMTNLTIENNILSSVNATSILVKKQSNSKYPTNLTIRNNVIAGYSMTFTQSPIDYSQVASDANIVSFNNSIVVYNETFFNYFDETGQMRSLDDWDYLNNSIVSGSGSDSDSGASSDSGISAVDGSYYYNSLVFSGTFSGLTDQIMVSDDFISLRSRAIDRISNAYREIDYEQYDELCNILNNKYLSNAVFDNIKVVLNELDLIVDSFDFNYQNPDGNPFVVNGLDNVSIMNNNFYLVSDSFDLLLVNDSNDFSFINNSVLVDSANFALVFNNSNASVVSNNITINANHSAILNIKSNVDLVDNEINTWLDESGIVDDINSTDEAVYVIDDSNYTEFFDDDGRFRDDIEIEPDSIIRLGNLTDKTIIIDIPLNITSIDEDSQLLNCFLSLESSNVNITGLKFIFNESTDSNPITIDSAENISINGNYFHFASNSTDCDLILINQADSIDFSNNTVILDCNNYALHINNSNVSVVLNNITINANHSAVLNANQSNLVFEDNIVNTLFEETELVDNVNSTKPKQTYYIVNDTNYLDYFNEDGTFRDDFEIEFGNTLKLANLTDKNFIIDIPLKITSLDEDCILKNSIISLGGESSNSSISNLRFEWGDGNLNDINFISINDGVSNILIANNSFSCDSNGNGSISAIKLFGSEYVSQNITIENNTIDFNNSDDISSYGIYLSNRKDFFSFKNHPAGLIIRNNNISISSGSVRAIYLDSIKDVLLESNRIFCDAINSNSIELSNASNFVISNNSINNSASNYRHEEDILESFNSAILLNENIGNNILKDGLLYIEELNGTIKDNILYENGLNSSMIHSQNNTKDLQNLIDNADGLLELGTRIYDNLDTLRISKNITISGGVFVSNNHWNALFEVLDDSDSSVSSLVGSSSVSASSVSSLVESSSASDSAGSSDSSNSTHYKSFNYLNIINGIYYLNNADLLVLLNAYNSTDRISIEIPQVNISNNSFSILNDSVVAESINVLKLLSNRANLHTTNSISIKGNTLASGINPFKFEVSSIMDGSDIEIAYGPMIKRKASRIIFEDMVTSAFQSAIDGRIGKYFEIVLKDEDGNVLSDKFVQIGFNGRIYNRTTDENGSAKLQINLAYAGVYTFAISFLGDDDYNASFEVAKITVNKQSPVLSVSDKSYKSSAKTKTLQASLKSVNGNPIKFKKVSFTVNGKTYTASTNSNGIASVNVSLTSKKTYKFTVKTYDDGTYSAVSKSAKLVIK